MFHFLSGKNKNMCQKLKEIHELRPNMIFKKYCGDVSLYRIKASDILDKMGIRYYCTDFTPLEKDLCIEGNDTILGIACSEGDELNILYSHSLDEITENYVLAHELAHCCLHLPVSSEFHVELKTENDIFSPNVSAPSLFRKKIIRKREDEADLFAADLLIPDDELAKLTYDRFPTINSMSRHFNVPEFLVRKKFKLNSKRIGAFV